MIELDVQLTADGAVVVIHDDDVDRTTDGQGLVATSTLAALQALDAGGWFDRAFAGATIPTLREVLAAVPCRINVEIKAAPDGRTQPGLEAATLAEVQRSDALRRIIFSSFSLPALHRLRGLSPDAEIGVLCGAHSMEPAFAAAQRVAARALHVRKDVVTAELIARAHATGLEVRVWTVNEPKEFSQMVDLGVDGVFTDHPERFLQKDPGARRDRDTGNRRSS